MNARRRHGRRTLRHLALLRGINVGGKNKLPMQELQAIFEAAGCEEVRTYIQSGNVVFQTKAGASPRVGPAVSTGIAEDFGYDIPVVLRSAARVHEVVRGNPFVDEGADPKTLHVAFLEKRPTAAKARRLDPDRSPTDRFVVRGAEIYLHCPNGIGKSNLTNAYFDATLETVSTLRNWKTVLRLAAMLDE